MLLEQPPVQGLGEKIGRVKFRRHVRHFDSTIVVLAANVSLGHTKVLRAGVVDAFGALGQNTPSLLSVAVMVGDSCG